MRSALIGALAFATGLPMALAQDRAVNVAEDKTAASGGASGAERAVVERQVVRFGFGDIDPNAAARGVLDGVAARVLDDDTLSVHIDAHTDNRGWSLGNIELSRLRARAVARELAARGVSLARVSARAYGESSPVASNATAEGRRRNRRAELTLLR